MNIDDKRAAALQLLSSTGIRRSNYAPPILRLFWKLGLDIPPPHFASFGQNAILGGIYFAIFWGLFMWFVLWSRTGVPPWMAITSSVIAGALFGVCMAAYFAYGKRKHSIPSWDDFNP